MAEDRLGRVRSVAGVDASYDTLTKETRAATAVLAYPELLDQAVVMVPTRVPYVPGFLSFREVPAVLETLAQLKPLPDLLLALGHGYAHPPRFGFGSHLSGKATK